MLTLVNHPEYNSTLMLLSNAIVSDTRLDAEDDPPLRVLRARYGLRGASIACYFLVDREGMMCWSNSALSTLSKPDKQGLVSDQSQDQHQHHEGDSQDAPTVTVILTPAPRLIGTALLPSHGGTFSDTLSA